MSVAGFIATQRAQYQIPHATSCRALEVSQAWFYKWRHGDPSARHARREQLRIEIARLFAGHKSRYGSPRITADLRDLGWSISVNTVAQIMAELGLRARRPRRRQTTRPGRGRWRAPDLVGRDFTASGINCKWFGDGTEIITDEGKLYLDSVVDLGSRRVLGFGLSEHHDGDLAYAALAMAVAVRGGKDAVQGVIFHSDQGGEYTGHRFREACQRLGIRQSMGRPGSALDNAVIESWHSTVEFELRRLEHFPSKAQARVQVAAWIDDYNTDRRHSALGMQPPVRYERQDQNPLRGVSTVSGDCRSTRTQCEGWLLRRRGRAGDSPGGVTLTDRSCWSAVARSRALRRLSPHGSAPTDSRVRAVRLRLVVAWES